MRTLGFLKKATIIELLRSRGYRGAGLTRIRAGEGVKHLIEFEVLPFAAEGCVNFTISLGVVIEAVWRIYYGQESGKKIREADCFPRFRVGEVVQGGDRPAKDLLWTLGKLENEAALAAEVKACVTEHCLPTLDRLSSISAVYEFFTTTQSPPARSNSAAYTQIMWAIVSHLYGDTARAETTLNSLHDNRRLGDEWNVRIEDVRERLSGTRLG